MQKLFWTLSKYIFKIISKSADYLEHAFWITAERSHFYRFLSSQFIMKGKKKKKDVCTLR